MLNLNLGQSSYKCGIPLAIYKKLPEDKSSPMGENSPNLVALLGSLSFNVYYFFFLNICF
jgi:hypothetical protein